MSEPVFTHKPETRHLGTVTLWPSDILNCLQLPEGATVCYIGLRSNPQTIEIVIEHPALPEVPEMCSAPALMQKAYSEGPFEDALNKEIYWKTYVIPVIPGAEDTGEHNFEFECNRPAHQDGHHGPDCYPGMNDVG